LRWAISSGIIVPATALIGIGIGINTGCCTDGRIGTNADIEAGYLDVLAPIEGEGSLGEGILSEGNGIRFFNVVGVGGDAKGVSIIGRTTIGIGEEGTMDWRRRVEALIRRREEGGGRRRAVIIHRRRHIHCTFPPASYT
jgi:hypothetical protein